MGRTIMTEQHHGVIRMTVVTGKSRKHHDASTSTVVGYGGAT